MRTFAVVTIVLALAASAQAGVITSFVKVADVNIGGVDYSVWDMQTNATSDWTNSLIAVTLETGMIYQDPVGGDTQPNPAFFTVFPSLEWDTYLATPGGYERGASFAGDNVMTPTEMRSSWFDTADDGAGLQTIARITLSSDANGQVSGKSYDRDTQGAGVPFGPLPIVNGQIVPEPATMALLALGGLAAVLRRRR